MANFIGGIISIAIGAVVLASVFIATIKGTNTTTWTAAEVSMWGLLSLVGIVGLLYGVLQVFGVA
jgi:predicted phage tail protein